MCVEERVDLWGSKAAKDERLSVVFGPAIKGPHSNSREVCAVGVLGLEVQMREQVL